MGKLWDLMSIERKEIGTSETPKGSNDIKYNRAYWGELQSYVDLPWCVVFQWWAAKQAGVPFPNTAHCNGVEAYARERGQWVSKDFEVGDFVIFDYDKDGSRDHIGFVTEVENGCVKTTIEGNYGDAVAGVNRRADCSIVGAYRPDWKALDGEEPAEEPAPEPAEEPETDIDVGSKDTGLPDVLEGDFGPAVVAVQVLLKYNHGCSMPGSFTWRGIPDGEFGPEVKACLKGKFGKEYVDGDVWKKLIGGIG